MGPEPSAGGGVYNLSKCRDGIKQKRSSSAHLARTFSSLSLSSPHTDPEHLLKANRLDVREVNAEMLSSDIAKCHAGTKSSACTSIDLA